MFTDCLLQAKSYVRKENKDPMLKELILVFFFFKKKQRSETWHYLRAGGRKYCTGRSIFHIPDSIQSKECFYHFKVILKMACSFMQASCSFYKFINCTVSTSEECFNKVTYHQLSHLSSLTNLKSVSSTLKNCQYKSWLGKQISVIHKKLTNPGPCRHRGRG